MLNITGISPRGHTIDKDASEQLNRQQKALDNTWLHDQVEAGIITQQNYLDLLIIKDVCEHVYPGLWDLQVEVHTINYDIKLAPSETRMGAYFFYEDGDNREYFNLKQSAETTHWLQGHQLNLGDSYRLIFYKFRLVIKFPRVTITNTGELQHEIRDIYFSLLYGHGDQEILVKKSEVSSSLAYRETALGFKYHLPKFKIEYRLEAARETVTAVEIRNRYLHSHANGRNLVDYTRFMSCCLGDGEINQVFAMADAELTPELFTLLLYQIDAYAKWESIEGGPYVHISNLARGSKIYIPSAPSESLCNTYFSRLCRKYRNNPALEASIDWRLVEGQYKIVENEKFIDFCKIHSRVSAYENDAHLSAPSHALIYYQNIQGELFDIRSSDVAPADLTEDFARTNYFLFKGEPISLKCIPVTGEIPMEEGYVLNPNIIKHIKTKLEGHANYKKARDYSIRRAITASHQ